MSEANEQSLVLDEDQEATKVALTASQLNQLKRKAIRTMEIIANESQNAALGTPYPARQLRFDLNALASQAILAGTASSEQTEMMQTQLDAHVYAQHPLIASMTLTKFAEFIAALSGFTYVASGSVEKVLIIGRADVNRSTTKAEIDAAIVSFNTLVASESAMMTGKYYSILYSAAG